METTMPVQQIAIKGDNVSTASEELTAIHRTRAKIIRLR
jgi:hypothetical protein